MDVDREALRKAFSYSGEDERTKRILGKIDTEIEEARRQSVNVIDSNVLRLARIPNEADRALAMQKELRVTRLQTRLDDIADSVTPDRKTEIDKEIRRLRK